MAEQGRPKQSPGRVQQSPGRPQQSPGRPQQSQGPKKPSATKSLRAQDVRYLAFEGGGGKGVTYLGAVEALEDLKILPVGKPAARNKAPGTNQIRGIAGASAGAITALYVALGYAAAALRKVLADPEKFNAFFDDPLSGRYRVIDGEGRLQAGSDPGVDQTVVELRKAGLTVAASAISALLPKSDDPIMKALSGKVKDYLYNVLYDRGLFPGFAASEFFRNVLRDAFEEADRQGTDGGRDAKRNPGESGPGGPKDGDAPKTDAGDMTFAEFHQRTGVDLVLTGVNVTTKRVGIWSSRHTPQFPVAQAVAISMNIPLLFKPVRIDPGLDRLLLDPARSQVGFWVDGGVLNNLPLHAFDGNEDNPGRNESTGVPLLHPNVLGLRLAPGRPANVIAPPPAPAPLEQGLYDTLGAYLSDLFDTFSSPAEEGQIRTPQERAQTIELHTDELSLTEFAPPAEKSEWPIANARDRVTQYFASSRE